METKFDGAVGYSMRTIKAVRTVRAMTMGAVIMAYCFVRVLRS